eukprot:9748391-Ditylum_brightwellii.AAC.1
MVKQQIGTIAGATCGICTIIIIVAVSKQDVMAPSGAFLHLSPPQKKRAPYFSTPTTNKPENPQKGASGSTSRLSWCHDDRCHGAVVPPHQ